MSSAAYHEHPSELRGFSLIEGGALWRAVTKPRWVRRDLSDVQRGMLAVALFTWLPLAILSLVEQLAFGWRGAFVHDIGVHARMLVALPLALYAEKAIGRRFEAVIRYTIDAGLIDGDNRAKAMRAIARAERMRDAVWIEPALAVVALALSAYDLALGPTGPRSWIFARPGEEFPLSAAGTYYLVVSVPVIRFVVVRWLWRIAVWTTLLIGLARSDLKIDPAHPDRAGGLAFFGGAHTSFGWLALAVGTTLAGNLTSERILLGRSVMEYWSVVVAFSTLTPVVFLLPLLAFSWPLERARRRAQKDYGTAAADFARRYVRQWIDPRTRSEIPLGSSETSAHTDLNTSFEAVHHMRWVPFTRAHFLFLFAMSALPMLAFVTQEVPLIDVLKRIKDTLG